MLKKLKFQSSSFFDSDKEVSDPQKKERLEAFYQTFDFFDLIKQWPEIVGPMLGQNTSPLRIKGDSLFVVTKHAAFAQQLNFLTEIIKEKIFQTFPKLRSIIKKVVYETNPHFFKEIETKQVEQKAKPAPIHPMSPQYRKAKAEAEQLFNHLEDAEFRASMISIYIQAHTQT
ncbi:MAG: DUF721 domain-containing protein [Bacteriovoracaceae bacterium]|jgi:hypothetical protein